MIANLTYLKQQFDDFNRRIFNRRMPPVILRINNSKTMLGCVHYKARQTPSGKKAFTNFSMSISAYYDLPQEELDDTILHEMIHLDILSSHMTDDSAHGPLFRQEMEDINARFDRHITISHKGKLERASYDKPEESILAVSLLEDGEWGITRTARTRIFEMYRNLPKYFHLKETKWYFTINPYFSRFPKSLVPKIYKIGKENLDLHLQGARPLEFRKEADGRLTVQPKD